MNLHDIAIAPATGRSIEQLAACDFSFDVAQEMQAPYDTFDSNRIKTLDRSYRKSYGFEPGDLLEAVGQDDRIVFVAEADGRSIGYLMVSRCWSGFALVDDLAIDRQWRGGGIARMLMDHAVAWTRQAGMPGIRLETQSTNVAACRFYARYGFVLGGHDRYLYQALHPGTREVALFWYMSLVQDVDTLKRQPVPHRHAAILRGEIYWIAPTEDRGSVPPIAHPYLVVQDDLFNASRVDTVVVCGITSNLKRVSEPGTVLLDEHEGGLSRRSIVLASQISSVGKAQLGERIGMLDQRRVEQVLAALRLVHGLHQASR